MTAPDVRVVEILDAASAAAWDCRSRRQAICAVQATLSTSPAAPAAAAYAASLMRAALIVEQGEKP